MILGHSEKGKQPRIHGEIHEKEEKIAAESTKNTKKAKEGAALPDKENRELNPFRQHVDRA